MRFFQPRLTFFTLRHLFVVQFLLVGGLIAWATLPTQAFAASSSSATTLHPARPLVQRSGGDTIIIVGGDNTASAPNGSNEGYDCQQTFSDMINYIKQPHLIGGQWLTWHRTFDIQTLKFYQGGTNCTADLHSSMYTQHCSNYVPGNEGSNNESIYHLSCLFAWYIYLNYGIHPGWNVEIVAHSMGGLIVRNAIYQVQKNKAPWAFPPTLGGISDVVTFGTPHGGVPVIVCGGCQQGVEMQYGSQFMNEMFNSAQNPQAANGTDWTLMGSQCDPVGNSAVYMVGGRKSVFHSVPRVNTPSCYGHSGYIHDTSDTTNAPIAWCDGSNCDIGGSESNWTGWASAPHSLYHMMYALWLSNW